MSAERWAVGGRIRRIYLVRNGEARREGAAARKEEVCLC